jgi:hypothetical protein
MADDTAGVHDDEIGPRTLRNREIGKGAWG